MHLTGKLGLSLVVTAMLAAAVPASATGSSGAGFSLGAANLAAAGDPVTAPADRVVTLITGDVVRLDRAGHVSVDRAPGRGGVSYLTQTVKGHQQVIPSDALPLVNSGKLDRRLFDVTQLVASGYGGARADLPLIVASPGSEVDPDTTREVATGGKATLTRSLPALRGYAVRRKQAHAADYWKSLTRAGTGAGRGTRTLRAGVTRVWLDGKTHPTLDVSVPHIGAPQAWAAGLDGAGVPVGVIDTGIDDSHPDLAGKVLAAKDFTADGDLLDRVGHGTHVASTIAGTGAASGGKFRGVAPGTQLYSAKACTDDGCDDSAIVAAMTWMAATEHARVVNMSLGGPDTPGVDPLEAALNTLTDQYGTLFVVAAGNDGYAGEWTNIGTPGTADSALTVGAVMKDDAPAVSSGDGRQFSSTGPRLGDFAVKPDITAPGVAITAARSKNGHDGTPDPADDRYVSMDGTSMATPHVAGAAAVLAEQHADWDPARLKAGLMASAQPNPAMSVFQQGAGRVDVARAITQAVTTAPASVGFGRLAWPHTDDTRLTRTVTYRNPGTTPLTFTLALDTVDEAQEPTAEGLFSLSTATLTVPAGGEASVDVSVDGRRSAHDGHTGGELTASAGAVVVRTPLGVELEKEAYDVTLVHKDFDGSAPTRYATFLARADTGEMTPLYDASGTVKLRLPRGDYLLNTSVFRDDRTAFLAVPRLVADRRQTVVLDARKSKPVSARPAGAGFALVAGGVSFSQPSAGGYSAGISTSSLDGLYTAQIGSRAAVPGFFGNVTGQWARTGADGSAYNPSDFYGLSYFTKGYLPTGFSRTLSPRNTAVVKADLAEDLAGGQGRMTVFGIAPGADSVVTGGGSAQFDLPGTFVAHVNTDNGVRWAYTLQQGPATGTGNPPAMTALTKHQSTPVAYRTGRTYRTSWNRGIFQPAIPADSSRVARSGDWMALSAGVFADGAGRWGASRETGSTTVHRNGELVRTAASTNVMMLVPPERGRYTVVQDSTRAAPFTTSVHNTATWSFTSGHVDETRVEALPLSAVRFTPTFDRFNRIVGRADRVPYEVQRVAGSKAGRVRSLTVRVSFDDGVTWRRVSAAGGRADLRHPAGHGFVSVRSNLTDTAGNTFEGTVIRAYAY